MGGVLREVSRSSVSAIPVCDPEYAEFWECHMPGNAMCCCCVEVLRPSHPMGSCRARLVYLTTHLLGRLSPLSG